MDARDEVVVELQKLDIIELENDCLQLGFNIVYVETKGKTLLLLLFRLDLCYSESLEFTILLYLSDV